MPNAATAAAVRSRARSSASASISATPSSTLEKGDAPLQHHHPGRAGRPDRRQVPQGPPAGPRRPPAQASLPAPREALFRSRQPRLSGLAGVRRRRRHVHLQRPPLARGLPRHGPAGASRWCCSATTRRPTTSTIPSPRTCACSTTASSVQAGAYQNACWVVATAKAGVEDGHGLIGGSLHRRTDRRDHGPGAVRGRRGDRLRLRPRPLRHYKSTVFAFDQHRRIEHYGLITERTGAIPPPG